MIRGISTTLFQVQRMKMTASISMLDSKGSEPTWYNMFRGNGGNYLTISTNASLKIKYLKDKLLEGTGGDDWSRQEQIYITSRSLGGFKQDVASFYRRFQRPDLFRYDDNNIPISLNIGNRDTVPCKFDSGQICTFEPAIVVSSADVICPGVIMRINMMAQEVCMTVEEFESFYDIVQNIKLYEIGAQLLQTYLIMNRVGGQHSQPEKTKPTPAYILYEQAAKDDDSAEADITITTPMRKQPTTLDEL